MCAYQRTSWKRAKGFFRHPPVGVPKRHTLFDIWCRCGSDSQVFHWNTCFGTVSAYRFLAKFGGAGFKNPTGPQAGDRKTRRRRMGNWPWGNVGRRWRDVGSAALNGLEPGERHLGVRPAAALRAHRARAWRRPSGISARWHAAVSRCLGVNRSEYTSRGVVSAVFEFRPSAVYGGVGLYKQHQHQHLLRLFDFW